MSSSLSNSQPTLVRSSLTVRDEGASEFVLTVNPLPGEGVIEMFTRLGDALNELEAALVHLTVFGSVHASGAGSEAMRRVFGRIAWPITWVEGAACDTNPIAGLQAFALTSGAPARIERKGQVVGCVFEHGGSRHCLLGGLHPTSLARSQAFQTSETLEQLQAALQEAGFSLADVARTWFFLDNILSWYDEFNRARTEFYRGVKFRNGSLPASTGVGARNCARAALAISARAIQPLSSDARVVEVASPLQCPAPAYGSSFSRAVEISSNLGRHLLISGTASIAPGGQTLWRDDVRKQIAMTMEVVEAILSARGFDFSHVTRATAYFKHPAHARFFGEYRVARGLLPLPMVSAHCDICRDDLLFELEADAWKV